MTSFSGMKKSLQRKTATPRIIYRMQYAGPQRRKENMLQIILVHCPHFTVMSLRKGGHLSKITGWLELKLEAEHPSADSWTSALWPNNPNNSSCEFGTVFQRIKKKKKKRTSFGKNKLRQQKN